MAPRRKKIPLTSQTPSDSSASRSVEHQSQQVIPLELQQKILDCFSRRYFADAENVNATIHEVKTLLFKRDFIAAFSQEDRRTAYIARWSPSRALAYASIFANLQATQQGVTVSARQPDCPLKVFCVGGGAGAEVMALAASYRTSTLSGMHVIAVDLADWSCCLDQLKQTIQEPPPLSAYASESAKQSNKALLPPEQHNFQVSFLQRDVLTLSETHLRPILEQTNLVTIMFTLNELFSTSMSRATAFLLSLSDLVVPGCWLLIVDSPGSYSEIKLGQEGKSKQYPMKWLIDHTLLEVAGEEKHGGKKWVKVESNESKWFRLDPSLKYPIALEDMRYQLHLYRRAERLSDSGPDK